jgi:hypothetical protein
MRGSSRSLSDANYGGPERRIRDSGPFMIVKIYLDDLVRFLREASILSGSEEPLERGAIVVA